MSYVLPPNNAIAVICSQDQPESLRKTLFDMDLELQQRDFTNTPEGAGPVRGLGIGRSRR